MSACWWKFRVCNGVHLVRAVDINHPSQSVHLDGECLDAPAGTLIFTGPCASLLEFQESDTGWNLFVDGECAEPYDPGVSGALDPAQNVTWFKFSLATGGSWHHVRVVNMGSPLQQVYLDAELMEAPEGTSTFTGPNASFLELVKKDGIWVLLVDGSTFHQHNPNANPSDPEHTWDFSLPGTGSHRLHVTHVGRPGQEINLDNCRVAAPEGTLVFTGPGASLLEFQQQLDGRWLLLVDGTPYEAVSSDRRLLAEAYWTFLAPQTGTVHQMRVLNVGRSTQEISIDSVVVPAPPGTTFFTGPGGTLLELRPQSGTWTLFVDGVEAENFNARSSTLVGNAVGDGSAVLNKRSVVDTGSILPMGVSQDVETGQYQATIKIDGRFKNLGIFATPEEAQVRYLAAKAEYKRC